MKKSGEQLKPKGYEIPADDSAAQHEIGELHDAVYNDKARYSEDQLSTDFEPDSDLRNK